MNVLVTGGTGYIGSHIVLELLQQGYRVAVIDNLSNSRPEVVRRISAITGCEPVTRWGDVRNRSFVVKTLDKLQIDAVIHLAGYKAVGESVSNPSAYYDNNVIGTIKLLEAMKVVGVRSIIFSSSATVYGNPISLPLKECHPLNPTNPYGRTKLFSEEILKDVCGLNQHSVPDETRELNNTWRIGILRYFNPAGAHPCGQIGEDPRGEPGNLIPYIGQILVGRRRLLQIYGNDYPTPDGTGVRDFIHVMDIARGHHLALNAISEGKSFTLNLGAGRGHSVLEVVRSFEAICQKAIPFEFAPRRSGDVASSFADPSAALDLLGWRAEKSIHDICSDHWRWQQANPNGYMD